jgi:hypothetical protein
MKYGGTPPGKFSEFVCQTVVEQKNFLLALNNVNNSIHGPP